MLQGTTKLAPAELMSGFILKNCNQFLRTSQGPHSTVKDHPHVSGMWFYRLYKNAHSQSILIGLWRFNLFAPPPSLHFSFTWLQLLVNSCKKQKMLYLLWAIFKICFGQPRSIKNTFQATTFKVEENSRTFQGLAPKFKDFSRRPPKIKGLFNTVKPCNVPWLHVPCKVASWNHATITGFSGNVSVRLAVCREKDANEGTGWWKEGHENIGSPGWRCNTCEKRIPHQSHSAFWERAIRGAASKGNTSGHQNERWLHHYTVNGRFYDGTLPDFGGGRKMEVKAMCQARRTA